MRLRHLRESRNMSQEDAAHLVGVAVKTWHNWESGKRTPYESNWQRIADSFEVDVQPIRGRPPTPLGLGAGETETQVLMDLIRGLDDQVRLLQVQLATRDVEVLTKLEEVHLAIRALPEQQHL